MKRARGGEKGGLTTRRVPALALERIDKVHPGGVRVLREVSLTAVPGTFTALLGPSGAGKTTLLHCAAGLDTPTGGRVLVEGTEIGSLDETRRTELRRRRIGFVSPSCGLFPELSAADNITLPLRLSGQAPDRVWLRAVLERTGTAGLLTRRTGELPAGQRQRVALARALVARPAVLLADEPTGSLDPGTAHELLDLLAGLVGGLGQTLVLATHDPVAAAWADRALVLAEGRIVATLEAPTTAELVRCAACPGAGRPG
ncbi:ATP-binding cassette domain-containing protein [Streptomyces sp. TRM 70361]|uniref:ABC transporter ATP-binding protein n=1 Tax=Streptomyces sp. TRM 70361 TaxID=3116553 RepID=UPI002E7AE531|nr:ATP-binding cassette domain-containing protein [Streptomyces sp. TRM 70361]MEE1939014.1 ATP-binding cassette domain-containing protein [Streptomyces sp. TRM 70361]